ncbi:undecaprenyl-diphosphatase [Gottschalkia purinilytica]|uniref:Undecaprenyl-diphosphatase n=1 Tax=Gottschalkia purinilytica TaxID=1503 RepID=A0A0L0WBQ3_GOTPU|nr:undecaprenyl-diphosphate phosphatase [Gottschalkia purinilytica]KNF08877.1 undecaprenyl-diphosphatase [Gottschalkia purinilytica]
MTYIQAIILGIFQGIAEFLPISSSGHLVLLQNFFDIKEGNLFFTEMLHVGTLISIFVVYFKDITKLVVEFFAMIAELFRTRKLNFNNEHRILGLMIIIGSIPTGLIGILLKDTFEGFYSSMMVIGVSFLITGLLLWISEKTSSGRKDISSMRTVDAVTIGIFQGLAITPGISRSGSTIVGALFRGLNKESATKYSFLLSVPAVLGAGLLELKDIFISSSSNVAFTGPILLGMALSAVTGIIAIKFLVKLLQKGKLHYFSYYVWILGTFVIVKELFF